MKIALIWPHGFDVKYVMPLPLGYLKSNLPSTHDVRIFDCALANMKADSPEFLKMLREFNPDMVGVSCWAPTYKEAVRAVKVAKALNPNVITVMGGVEVTSYADYISEHEKEIDFLFTGEADLSFPAFVEQLESKRMDFSAIKGLIYRSPEGKSIKNPMDQPDGEILDSVTMPDYKAMDLHAYIRNGYKFSTLHEKNAPVWITRGCPYICQYCAAPLLNGRTIRKHSIKYSMEWIRYLHDVEKMEHINIIDDNFTFDIKYAKEFCRALIEEKIGVTMGTPNGIRMQMLDEELVQLMKKAGWENLVVAPESGSVSTLQRMKKGLRPEVVPPIVKMIRKNGLKVHGFFILGYPGDTKEDLETTLTFAQECDFDFFFLNNFQALPGTPVFDELVQKGEITSDFLPTNYSDGQRSYTPEVLKDVNFPKLVLKQYVMLYAKDPSKLLYGLKLFPPGLVVKKLVSNFKNSLRKETPKPEMSNDEFDAFLKTIMIPKKEEEISEKKEEVPLSVHA